MYIVGIDIGITNLAWCLYDVDLERFVAFKRVNISLMKHKKVQRTECKLRHEAVCVDWVDHFLQEYHHVFQVVDVVIIERQPPGGHTAVEQLLYDRLRSKAMLVAPTSLHKFTNTMGVDYDISKAIRVKRFRLELEPSKLEAFDKMTRSHDVADAGIMCLWWVSKNVKKPLPEIPATFKWDQYAYAPT